VESVVDQRSGEEQLAGRNRVELVSGHPRRRQLQRNDGKSLLARHTGEMAAGDQDGELGGTGENGAAELCTGRQMMFSVVDHQQARQRAYVVDDLLNGCLRGAAYAEGASQRAEHRRWIIECPDGKPVDSVGEARGLGGGVPDSDPGLADSGWS